MGDIHQLNFRLPNPTAKSRRPSFLTARLSVKSGTCAWPPVVSTGTKQHAQARSSVGAVSLALILG